MPFQEKLDHACRRWQAEEENSRRIGTRSRQMATLVVGLLGVVLARILWTLADGSLRPPERPEALLFVVAVLAAGLGSLGLSLAYLLDAVRREKERDPGPASAALALGDDEQNLFSNRMLSLLSRPTWTVGDRDPEAEHLRSFEMYTNALAIERAADNLSDRNALEHKRYGAARDWLIWAVFLIVLATLVWLYNGGRDEQRHRTSNASSGEQP